MRELVDIYDLWTTGHFNTMTIDLENDSDLIEEHSLPASLKASSNLMNLGLNRLFYGALQFLYLAIKYLLMNDFRSAYFYSNKRLI